jgi:hypothetical protein
MTFEEQLYAYLSADTDLTALVGKRIYPEGEVPQKPGKPYCVYSRVFSDRLYSHQGFSGLEDVSLQVNCYSETALQARQVSIRLTAAMEAWITANSNAQKVLRGDSKGLYDGQLDLPFHMVEFSITHSFSEEE